MSKRPQPPNKKDKARISEAVDYKLQGHGYAQIAEQMNISEAQAAELVHKGLSLIIQDPGRESLLLDLARLDQMLTAVYPHAVEGDREAIRTVLVLRHERERIKNKLEPNTFGW